MRDFRLGKQWGLVERAWALEIHIWSKAQLPSVCCVTRGRLLTLSVHGQLENIVSRSLEAVLLCTILHKTGGNTRSPIKNPSSKTQLVWGEG